jgi:hypothetical protein
VQIFFIIIKKNWVGDDSVGQQKKINMVRCLTVTLALLYWGVLTYVIEELDMNEMKWNEVKLILSSGSQKANGIKSASKKFQTN